MDAALFIMAILGCGEADVDCRQIATVESRYESLDACNAATSVEVERRLDEAYPVVVAQCQRADARTPVAVSADAIDLPEPTAAPPIRRASAQVRSSRG